MPVDPNISLQAGRPPAGSEAGAGLTSNNLLANPGALNTLMQLSGNMAAGQAINGAAGPDGNIDIATAVKNLTADPRTAPVALEALGKIQSIANAQYKRTQDQNNEAKGMLAGLMAKREGVTQDDYAGTIKSGFERGLIPKELAATLASQMPLNPMTGEFDSKRAADNITQMFLQRLSGPEQSAVINGEPHTFTNGNVTTTIMLPKLPGLGFRPIVQQQMQTSPAERQQLQSSGYNKTPGPEYGAETKTPMGAMPQVPAPPPAPLIGGDGKPVAVPGGAGSAPSAPKAAAPTTGRYPVSKAIAAYLAASNADAARAVVSKMSPQDRAIVEKYVSEQNAKRSQ